MAGQPSLDRNAPHADHQRNDGNKQLGRSYHKIDIKHGGHLPTCVRVQLYFPADRG